MFRMRFVLMIAASVPIALAACAPTPMPSQSSGATVTAQVKEITIKASEFKFEPNQFTLKEGQPVRLTLDNVGTVDHELEISDLKAKDVHLDLSQAGKIPPDEKSEAESDAQKEQIHGYAAQGGKAVVEFTPISSGTFEFACNLPGHKEAGMVGKVTVQP